MARRKHHATSGRALPLVILTIVAIAGIGVGGFALSSCGGGADEERPPPEFAFEVRSVEPVTVEKQAPQRTLTAAADDIAAVLSGLYTTAFVDSDEWQGGRFPGLPSFFAGAASERAPTDLEDLSLGSLAPRVERVEPGESGLEVSVLVDGMRNPVRAVALADFQANGRTRDGRPFRILHGGRFWLQPRDGDWRIVGYQVEGEMTPGDGQPDRPEEAAS